MHATQPLSLGLLADFISISSNHQKGPVQVIGSTSVNHVGTKSPPILVLFHVQEHFSHLKDRNWVASTSFRGRNTLALALRAWWVGAIQTLAYVAFAKCNSKASLKCKEAQETQCTWSVMCLATPLSFWKKGSVTG
jgi:hypothetical protein